MAQAPHTGDALETKFERLNFLFRFEPWQKRILAPQDDFTTPSWVSARHLNKKGVKVVPQGFWKGEITVN